MAEYIRAGELRKIIENIPDEARILLSSGKDTNCPECDHAFPIEDYEIVEINLNTVRTTPHGTFVDAKILP